MDNLKAKSKRTVLKHVQKILKNVLFLQIGDKVLERGYEVGVSWVGMMLEVFFGEMGSCGSW